MSRLPNVGSDDNAWGSILNDFLSVEHTSTGELKIRTDGTLAAKESVANKGVANGYAPLDSTGKVPTSKLPASAPVNDADATNKGILKLTGDLGGTADSPTVPGLATKATDANVVHIAGTETVTGGKTFSQPITGSLTDTTGSQSALVTSSLTGDPANRLMINTDGSINIVNGEGPYNGSHSTGSVGSGHDTVWYVEMNQNVAHILNLQFARTQIAPTGSPVSISYLSVPPNWTLMDGTGTLTMNSTSQFSAGGGSFTIRENQRTGTGTYTGTTSTTLTGVASSYVTDADVTSRHAIWIADSYGAPIMWISNYGGMRITDELVFTQGVFSSQNSLGFSYLQAGARTNPSLVFYGDNSGGTGGIDAYKGLYIRRTGTYTLTTTGSMLFPDGTTAAPSIGFAVSPGTGLSRTVDISGFSQLNFSVATTNVWRMDAAGNFYPIGAYVIGSSPNRVSKIYVRTGLYDDGVVGTPTITFTSDTTKGLYSSATNKVGMAISGALVAEWSSAGLNVLGNPVLTTNTQKRVLSVQVTDPNGAVLATGNGQAYVRVNEVMDGYNLVAVGAHVTTVSSSGTPTIQINNTTKVANMLSTAITIDANEKDTVTAATPAVIDVTHNGVSAGDELRIDITAAGTGARGLIIDLTFQSP
jgi:hypothetical protein